MAGPLQATFSTSSMEGATSCVDIRILQDLVLEGDHDFGVEVTSATPSVVMLGMPSEETVTILDDESTYVQRVKLQQTLWMHVMQFYLLLICYGWLYVP